jgi:replicative DNA helicase
VKKENEFLHNRERETLGYILSNGTKAYLTASRFIDETDFDLLPHRVIFGIIGAIISQGTEVSITSVHDFIHKHPDVVEDHLAHRYNFRGDVTKARAALIDLVIRLSTEDISPTFDMYTASKFIRENSITRQLIELYQTKLQQLAEGMDQFEAIDDMYDTAVKMYSRFENIRPFITLKDASDELIELLEKERRGDMVRLPTGYPQLDSIIKGYENGRLYTIGAEEKIGKSIFVSHTALKLAMKKIPVGMLSLEMKRTELARRYLSMIGGSEAIEKLDIDQLKEIAGPLDRKPLYLYDLSLNTKSLAAKIQQLKIEKNIRLVIVDYLQLVEPDRKAFSKTDEINNVVRTLKRLAMDLNIPIILIASLTIKGLYHRSDRKPRASDFRDSGQIPYDSDAILFLWKPEEKNDSYRELFVERSRYSRTGSPIGLEFDAKKLEFAVVQRREKPQNGEYADGPKYF